MNEEEVEKEEDVEEELEDKEEEIQILYGVLNIRESIIIFLFFFPLLIILSQMNHHPDYWKCQI